MVSQLALNEVEGEMNTILAIDSVLNLLPTATPLIAGVVRTNERPDTALQLHPGDPFASTSTTLDLVPPVGLAARRRPGSLGGTRDGQVRNSGAQDGIPIGALGRISREHDVLSVYEIVSPTLVVLALQVTPTEVEAKRQSRLEVTHVKTSVDRRTAVSVEPNKNVLISMGPNPEGKILHTVLKSGLFGPLFSKFTTCGTQPPGEGWQVLPPLA